jgi:hypothetical protein
VLGTSVPGIDQYLLPVIAIMIASAVPVAVELVRARRHHPSRHARTGPADRTTPAGRAFARVR